MNNLLLTRCIRKDDTLELIGDVFALSLRADVWLEPDVADPESEVAGSLSYSGIGMVLKKLPGGATQILSAFTFRTHHVPGSVTHIRSLRHLVVASDLRKDFTEEECAVGLEIIPELEPSFADMFCRRLLQELKKLERGYSLPDILFRHLPHTELVDLGFVAEASGALVHSGLLPA